MKQLVVFSLAVLLARGGGARGGALAAQQRDSMQRVADTVEAGRLRQRIDSVFSTRVQRELNLTPDQTTKLRATQERYSARRRDVLQQQVERRRALDSQMRPDMPANSDSVRKLMDGIQSGRAEMLRIDQDQDREMAGYLNPVQRARYQQLRERFIQRVDELRMERREGRGIGRGRGMGAGRPGVRGGRRRGI